jgi:hypothetical protein
MEVTLEHEEQEKITIEPVGVIRPIDPLGAESGAFNVNQTFPSEPEMIAPGKRESESGNSVITPLGVIRPIFRTSDSVNQILPSGPTVIPDGLPGAGNPTNGDGVG